MDQRSAGLQAHGDSTGSISVPLGTAKARPIGNAVAARFATREPSRAKPLWRGLLHLMWFELSLVGSAYVGLGCFGAVALPAIWSRVGVGACVLFAVGGACYIAGAGM